MVLTCPTAKEVPRYSFSNSPYQMVTRISINTHIRKKIGSFEYVIFWFTLLVLEVESQKIFT